MAQDPGDHKAIQEKPIMAISAIPSIVGGSTTPDGQIGENGC
jgi:hypothetical protein